jgi:hypothetical protein
MNSDIQAGFDTDLHEAKSPAAATFAAEASFWTGSTAKKGMGGGFHEDTVSNGRKLLNNKDVREMQPNGSVESVMSTMQELHIEDGRMTLPVVIVF